MPALDDALNQKIAALKAENRWREAFPMARTAGVQVIRGGRKLLSFSCNDYFGLSNHEAVTEAACAAARELGAGAAASRLVSGNHPLHEKLQLALAEYKGTEAATLFGSGYLANIGAIPALAGKGDLILADKLVHACMIDAAQLSGAKLLRFHHNDAAHCKQMLEANRTQYRHCLVMTETIFSMDGDKAPLGELRKLCDVQDAWLMTDDAHGLGVIADNPADVQMGTLSKGLGSYGGYVAGSKTLTAYLESAARSLIYSTALPPSAVAAALAALGVFSSEPERIRKPLAWARRFAEILKLPVPESMIVPIILGSEEAALTAAQKLEETGFLVVAIRPPTVPEGTARLRVSFSASHTPMDVDALAAAIKEVCDVHTCA